MTLIAPLAFVFGAIIGSFLNVVIYRLPRGESLIRPRSRCPACGRTVPFWANVPILSYLLLRGRCGACGAGIDPRYLWVELATALLFTSLVLAGGTWARILADAIVGSSLIAIAFIDGEHRIIPDVLTLPLIPFALVLAGLAPPPSLLDAGLGFAVGGGMLWGLSALYEWRAGRIGLGMGDVKLVGMLGAYMGLHPVLGVIVLGSLIGLVQGVWTIVRHGGGRKTPIPFGPALVAAGLLHLHMPFFLFHALDALLHP
jgi:leader peptidase (prepilin peptidase)/N-methyltransferase